MRHGKQSLRFVTDGQRYVTVRSIDCDVLDDGGDVAVVEGKARYHLKAQVNLALEVPARVIMSQTVERVPIARQLAGSPAVRAEDNHPAFRALQAR